MSRNSGLMLGSLGRLFSRGTITGLSEDELLDRFVVDRDEAAFAALVTRHGPMVLGVCRRILRDERDIEDAFQATFLILVRRAGSIRDSRLIGRWLHGVAHRVAVRSRVRAARRYVHERPVTGEFEAIGRSPAQIVGERELLAVLDEELARLPGALRSPMVLCYLEGLTHDEAASRLGWPVGTVRSRMARARDILHRRLSRRGIMASGAVLPGSMAKTSVSIALVDSTVRMSLTFLTKQTLAATVASLTAAGLANEVLHAMMLTRITVLGATGLTCALALGGPSLARQFTGAGGDAVQIEQGAGPVQITRADPPNTADGKPQMENPASQKLDQTDPEREKIVAEIKLEILKNSRDALKNRLLLNKQLMERTSKETEEIQNKLEQLRTQYADVRREFIKLKLEIDSTEAWIARLSNGQAVERGKEPKSAQKVKEPRPATRTPAIQKTKQDTGPNSDLPTTFRHNKVLYVVSPNGEKVSAYLLSGDKLKSVKLAEPGDPPLHVLPVFSPAQFTVGGPPAYTALQQTGKVRRLAFFTPKDWTWTTFELPESVDNAAPIVTRDEVIFNLGRSLATYSFQAKRWDILKLSTRLQPNDLQVQSQPLTVTQSRHIYRYDSKIGRWSDLDTKALLDQPDRDSTASPDKEPVQSEPR